MPQPQRAALLAARARQRQPDWLSDCRATRPKVERKPGPPAVSPPRRPAQTRAATATSNALGWHGALWGNTAAWRCLAAKDWLTVVLFLCLGMATPSKASDSKPMAAELLLALASGARAGSRSPRRASVNWDSSLRYADRLGS